MSATATNPLVVITNFIGMHVNAGNVVVGIKDIASQGVSVTIERWAACEQSWKLVRAFLCKAII